ncbi:linoleate 13S-lipoxygenase 2-1, chloroplastic-like isoform X2 [Camellia sinensis]|uniref:linoleate 13S-lipoxygenase 2-1, chloroplastic-like isoform X2 n=1 Tax=Camellia sinensis TaxID=4442 RepID=UPI001036A018|nr:linoleate 13S-lipoxygenase 2-1, chloroplastic-like isoform X2 [Camellia sinensis]
MLNSQVHQSHTVQILIPWHKPFPSGTASPSSSLHLLKPGLCGNQKDKGRVRCVPSTIKAIATTTTEQTTIVKAVVCVKLTVGGFLSNLGLSRGLDDVADMLGKSIQLELVSAELDPKTGLEKETIKGYAHRTSQEEDEVKYECNFVIPEGYGEIGAVLVENEHHKEMYLKQIVFHGFPPGGPVHVTCNSWVASKFHNPHKRIFFTNKSYLPSQTPDGLKRLREKELENLRGNGQGKRKIHERIYDYDVYNDIGDPDTSSTLKRPVLGGKQHPYPRRCRTGRPRSKTGDKFSWLRDEEFSRQTLGGLNPCSIQLVKEWPLKSKLDLKIYGPPESAITKELIERQIRGFMTLEEALQTKKLFMLDYHDLLLPYVNKVRESKGTTLYGSRTLFFLTPDGTLRPLAIELTRPPVDDKPQWKQVFTPTGDATGCWLWRLAKVHALAHDSGYHQLVSHWLRTHCVTEPYIIASNRQLSAMHPIYKLLHPHFRYTMEINALARQALINAGGIIETCFSPKKYSIELSSVAYDQQWRFDLQALPADLISRGMAMEDPTALHGLRLTIEDYPYASDGLLVWDAIKQWVTDYVKHYYQDASFVQSDKELQAWWTEIQTVGHGDKKDETWWPVLKTPQDLIGILTTMIWVTSGHHSAVNFGQYIYAGYFPNRPTIARTKMPTEEPTDEEWKCFINKPEVALLMCFPSQIQATKVMAVLDVLSNHSPDEEYLGKDMEASWIENPIIKAAFERFNGKLKELEGVIDRRNVDKNLKNRCGAGVVPYELLKPFSEPGVTGRGVPNSISI